MSEPLQVVCPHCHVTNRVAPARLADGAVCGKCKQALFAAHALELDGASFERHVAASDIPLVMDFWAPWCAPCRMAAPILEQVGRQQAGKLVVLKVNTDEHPEPSNRLGIRGIPTFIVFKDGREAARQAGVLPGAAMSQWVERSALA